VDSAQRPDDTTALRAEHDALAARLATRASVDLMKEGGVLTFFTAISLGMAAKLAWDRWGWLPVARPAPEGRYPLWFLIMTLVTLLLLWLALKRYLAAHRLRREEAALFARFRELRARLELDP
jgi:hypothetical protein